MKKILFFMTLLVMGASFAFAQTNADIKFDKTTHDFGKLSDCLLYTSPSPRDA